MKVRPSVKKMCDKCKIVKRKGVVKRSGDVNYAFGDIFSDGFFLNYFFLCHISILI